MTDLTQWATLVAEELELDAQAATDPAIKELLDLTREVAHNVTRPAGPITTFLIGLAVGQVGGDNDMVKALVEKINALVPQEQ